MNINFIRHWRMLSYLCRIRVLWFPLKLQYLAFVYRRFITLCYLWWFCFHIDIIWVSKKVNKINQNVVSICRKTILNPFLTRLFFVTYPTEGGGVVATPKNFYNKGPMMMYLVPLYRSWSPLSISTKIYTKILFCPYQPN